MQQVLNTKNRLTLPISGTGSAGMETCFVNLVEAGDPVLVLINGVFGMRMEVLRNQVSFFTAIVLRIHKPQRRRGPLPVHEDAGEIPEIPGRCIILAGSCSEATRRQIAWVKERIPAFHLDPLRLADKKEEYRAETTAWAIANSRKGPAIIYSSAEPEEIKAIQQQVGRETAGKMVEETFAVIAQRLQDNGVRRFIVAGGETAGSVVKGLGIKGLRIGPRIDPGVPWTSSLEPEPVALALKSGNFGTTDFFLKALELLP